MLFFIKSIARDESILNSVNTKLESPHYLEIVGNETIVYFSDDPYNEITLKDILVTLHQLGELPPPVLNVILGTIDFIYSEKLKHKN